MTQYLTEKEMRELDDYTIEKLLELGDWSENQINEWADKRGIRR
jgi:hypothetical protein